MILGFVNQQELTIVSPTVVADTINYLTAEFTFLSEDWQGLDDYYAHFIFGKVKECRKLINGKITEDAGLNLAAGRWEVGIYGEKVSDGTVTKRITTKLVPLIVKRSGITPWMECQKP